MATELNMPQMGYDMTEGTLVRWLVTEGSEVNEGDAIAEIETDKVVVEFPSTEAGILSWHMVPEGTTVPVGQPIAIIGAVGEDVPEPASAPEVSAGPPADEPAGTPLPTAPAQAGPPAGPVRASPVAKRLAEEMGIDLTLVEGTGPGGRITKDDVLAFEPSEQAPDAAAPPLEAPVAAAPAPPAESAAPPPPEPAAPVGPLAAAGETVPLSRMRQQIARVTVRSKREIPHFYVSSEIDMSEAMTLRKKINAGLESDGLRVTVNDMVVKACVGALKKYPNFNSTFAGDGLQMNESINVGIAMAVDEGLIIPAILDCGDKSLSEIAAASKDLIERSQSGTLRPLEYSGGTFSISNMGMFDVSSFVAIIYPPNAAVLAVGKVARKPVVRDEQLAIADMMSTTLSVDHRVADGAEGARFIVEVKRLLESPLSLLL